MPSAAEPAPPARPVPRAVVALFAVSMALLLAAVVGAFWLTRPPRPYPANTPERMLDSMAKAVQEGRAGRLVEFIEITPPDADAEARARMEDLYARLGRVLDAAQSLADATARAMPGEVERLRVEAGRGQGPSVLASLLGAARGGGSGRGRGGDVAAEVLGELLADPYGALAEGRVRITTEGVDDQTVALLWDGRPVLPPLGLIARRQPDGRWQVVPPTSLPVFQRALPRSENEFAILGSLLTAGENVLVDLEAEVRAGRHDSLGSLGRGAVEKAMVPVGMVMVAYSRARQERDAGP